MVKYFIYTNNNKEINHIVKNLDIINQMNTSTVMALEEMNSNIVYKIIETMISCDLYIGLKNLRSYFKNFLNNDVALKQIKKKLTPFYREKLDKYLDGGIIY